MINAKGNTEALPTVCEACGAKFTCCANNIEQCFCNKIILPKNVIEQIQNQYSHCLCKGCLQKWQQEDKDE